MGAGGAPESRPLFAPSVQAGLLVLVAGYADAVGFLRFDAFAGQMTGNTILLAVAALGRDWIQLGALALVMACFLAGLLVGGGLLRLDLPRAAVLAMAAAAIAAAAFVERRWGGGLLAFAMGLQNIAASQFGEVKVNTSFITGDLLRFCEALIARLWPRPGERRPAGFLVLALVWIEYVACALAGALAHLALAHPLLIPAAVLPFVLLRRPRALGL